MVNYDGRRFRSVSNGASGEVGEETVFEYRQQGGVVWATYSGGAVRYGQLIAVANEAGELDMRYQHVNAAGELRTGVCRSVPEVLPDGRIRLIEHWQWTDGEGETGTSVIEEIGG